MPQASAIRTQKWDTGATCEAQLVKRRILISAQVTLRVAGLLVWGSKLGRVSACPSPFPSTPSLAHVRVLHGCSLS